MEVYFAPRHDSPEAPLTRTGLLQLMQARGLEVVADDREERLATGVRLWTLGVAGGGVRITFQERQGVLVFATVEVTISTPVKTIFGRSLRVIADPLRPWTG